jgi:hypothetical protein
VPPPCRARPLLPPPSRARDADRSHKGILDAARVESAEHGLGRARRDGIAERAGVDKRLTHYYCCSMHATLAATIADVLRRGREAGLFRAGIGNVCSLTHR